MRDLMAHTHTKRSITFVVNRTINTNRDIVIFTMRKICWLLFILVDGKCHAIHCIGAQFHVFALIRFGIQIYWTEHSTDDMHGNMCWQCAGESLSIDPNSPTDT